MQKGLITNRTTWKAFFHTSAASAFLILKNKGDKKTLDEVTKLLEQLPASQKKLFRVIHRAELDQAGATADAALALTPIQGITFSATLEGRDMKPASGGTHGYFPDFKEIQTGFIAYGPTFKQGTVIPLMGLEDIAPIVNELLQLHFTVPDGILYPGLLAKTPAH